MHPSPALPILVLVSVFLGIPILVAWLGLVVSCANAKFEDPGDKTSWTLIVLLLGPLGGLLYFFGAKRRPHDSPQEGPFDA